MKKILLLILVSIALVGCTSDNGYSVEQDKPVATYKELIDGKMYYLPHDSNEPDLPINLKKLFEDNPNLELVDVEIDQRDNTQFNNINGYFVFTKEKE